MRVNAAAAAKLLGASLVKKSTSVAAASFYDIPNGYSSNGPLVQVVYFDSLESCNEFVKKFEDEPEMAYYCSL